jgi:tRNA pseudouridine-54 N-methylase
LAVLARKVLASEHSAAGFAEVRPGVALAPGGLDVALADLGDGTVYLLDREGPDLRDAVGIEDPRSVFVLGDDSGLDPESRAALTRRGARTLGVGPLDLHAEDVVAIVANEVDRRTRR